MIEPTPKRIRSPEEEDTSAFMESDEFPEVVLECLREGVRLALEENAALKRPVPAK